MRGHDETVPTLRYYYGGAMEVGTQGQGGTVKTIKTYWPLGMGVEIDKPNQVTELNWTHQDRIGSVIGVSDSQGNLTEKLAYDSWGKRRTLQGDATPDSLDGVKDKKGFTGHEMLDALDLVHMNGRVYDPLVARFMSADPIIQDPEHSQSYNRYTYVWNNPTNLTDPTGFAAASGNASCAQRSNCVTLPSGDEFNCASNGKSVVCPKGLSSDFEACAKKDKAAYERLRAIIGFKEGKKPTSADNSNGQGVDAANGGGGTCGMGNAATACHVAGLEQHPEETKIALSVIIPGGGLPEVYDDIKKGAYGMAIFGVVTEIPVLKWFKLGKWRKLEKLEEIAAKETPTLFRGGVNLEVRLGVDVKAAEDGLIHALSKNGKPQGLSLNVNPTDTFIQKYGGAFPVNSLPEGLQVLQSGKAGQFVISPSTPMSFEKFQQLLNKVEFGNFNKLP